MQSSTHGALIAKPHLNVQEMTTLLIETFQALPSVSAVQVTGSPPATWWNMPPTAWSGRRFNRPRRALPPSTRSSAASRHNKLSILS